MVQAHSKSKDCHVCRSRRCHQVKPEDCPTPYFEYHPPKGTQSPREKWQLLRIPIWRSHQNWGQRSPAFSEGRLRIWKRKTRSHLFPKSPVEELQEWVKWKAEAYEMPSWWRELMKVLEVEDCEKLAQEVWASFQLPKRASKLHQVENYHQAPHAPLCLLQKNFLLPPNSIFACQDIREIQCKRMVAYA